MREEGLEKIFCETRTREIEFEFSYYFAFFFREEWENRGKEWKGDDRKRKASIVSQCGFREDVVAMRCAVNCQTRCYGLSH